MNNKKNIKNIIIVLIIVLITIITLLIPIFLKQRQQLQFAQEQVQELLLEKEKTSNSLYKLNIVSTYGDNEAYHPKVLSFEKQWNGYKYWMSYTPYPRGDDSKENPHIAVSNDLINWDTICVLDEPKNYKASVRYNSDSHLVYNNVLNQLECYWRYVDDINNKSIIYRRTSKDGVNWTVKEVSLINNPRNKKDCVSPSIIFEDNIYKMWYVDKGNTLKYATSTDGINWGNVKKLEIMYEKPLQTWHLDVISTSNGYEMLVVAFDKWANHNDMSLYYTKSTDGFIWDTAKEIVRPTINTNNWDNKGIYRSSFVYENDNYYVFYSGTNKKYNHGIGLVYGNDINNLREVTIDIIN